MISYYTKYLITGHNIGISILVCNYVATYVLIYYFTEAEDYSQKGIIVTIVPGTVLQQFTINITNDNITECNETLYLSISTEEAWCGLNNSNGSVQVTIIDDDGRKYVTICR